MVQQVEQNHAFKQLSVENETLKAEINKLKQHLILQVEAKEAELLRLKQFTDIHSTLAGRIDGHGHRDQAYKSTTQGWANEDDNVMLEDNDDHLEVELKPIRLHPKTVQEDKGSSQGFHKSHDNFFSGIDRHVPERLKFSNNQQAKESLPGRL